MGGVRAAVAGSFEGGTVLKHANDNHTGLRFLSVCSGIEAASVAWHTLGWQAVAYSEIEKFPSAILAHHYPDVPNLGDFTKIDVTTLGRVDILAGGTPCQAFSVAGLRQSLADARGNLSLEFVRLAHELSANNGLRNAVWENVVGVLSTKDNAFGCFLGGLVGADDAVVPSERPADGKSRKHWKWRKGGRYPVLDDDGEETGEYSIREPWHALSWPSAGMVSGPKGRAAWRVLDAQYFGVAQRRRRVIVVADFGNGADPAAVLFEPEGVFRHSPPSRETGKDVAPTISARTKGGGGLGTDFDLDGGLLHVPEIARCVATREGSSQDYETTTMVAVEVAPTMRAGGNKTGGDRPYGTDVDTCDSLAVVHSIQAGALRTNPDSGPDGVGVQEGIAYTLEARSEVQAICITGEISHALTAEGHDASEDGSGRRAPIVCVHADAIGRSGDAATPSLDAAGVSRIRDPGMGVIDDGTSYNLMANGQPHAVAIPFDTTQITSPLNRSSPKDGDPCHPLSAGAHPPAVAFQTSQSGVRVGEVHATLDSNNGSRRHNGAVVGSAVRRLTPMECERLQGFPDGYTDIPWRGKPTSPDGPRYKALGNSWAVPKFAWLGKRIAVLMPKQKPAAANDNDGMRNEKVA
jgi:DNA (cytosine-5)-methyltransferase 1